MTAFQIDEEKRGVFRWRLSSDDRPLGRSARVFPTAATAILDIHLLRAGAARFVRRVERRGSSFRWRLEIDRETVAESARDHQTTRSADAELTAKPSASLSLERGRTSAAQAAVGAVSSDEHAKARRAMLFFPADVTVSARGADAKATRPSGEVARVVV